MSLGGHNSIHHHLWRFRNTELNEIFIFMSVRSFTLALVAIFIPIYFLSLGLSIQQVLLFYLVMHGGEFILEYPSSILLKRFGPKFNILLSVPFLLTHYYLLQSMASRHWPVWLVAIFGSIELALYYQAYHMDFVLSKKCSEATRQVATLSIIIALLSATAPFLGGFISQNLGFNMTLLIPPVLLFVASVALLAPTVSSKKVPEYDFGNFKPAKIKYDVLANFGAGLDAIAGGVFWPLFIYLIVKSYEVIGLVTSLGLLITVGVTFWVGRRSDKGERRKFMKFGDFSISAIQLVQSFARNILHIYMVNLLGSFSRSMRSAPYTSEYYLRATETNPGPYVYYMEASVDLARVLILTLLLGLSYYLALKYLLIISFVFGAIGAVIMALIPVSRQDKIEIKDAQIKMMPRPAAKKI